MNATLLTRFTRAPHPARFYSSQAANAVTSVIFQHPLDISTAIVWHLDVQSKHSPYMPRLDRILPSLSRAKPNQ